MTNINIELFKRYAARKKLGIIESLSKKELLAVKMDTVLRIVKEIGVCEKGNRNRKLRISMERRAGNDWNSNVEGISLYKKELFLEVYVQFDNTDTTEIVRYKDFFCNDIFFGELKAMNRRNEIYSVHYNYDDEDQAKVMKSILLEYVYTKYKDKLK